MGSQLEAPGPLHLPVSLVASKPQQGGPPKLPGGLHEASLPGLLQGFQDS